MVISIQIHGELLDVLLSVHNQFVFSTLILDVNNDGFLDEQELEALFTKEVKKKNQHKNFTCFKKCLQECLYFPQVYMGALDVHVDMYEPYMFLQNCKNMSRENKVVQRKNSDTRDVLLMYSSATSLLIMRFHN